MEEKIAVIAIFIEDREKAEEVNNILHNYANYVIGRMGVPYAEKNISIISIIINAPQPQISALSGKLGMIQGVKSKVILAQ